MTSPKNETFKTVDLEEIFAVSESIEELAETNPKLYEEIKSHFSAAPSPFSVPEQPKMAAGHPRSSMGRRFSLDTLPPNVAEIISLFDFNDTGKVTLEDVRRGAQELKKAKRKNKVALWAMVVQFLVYSVLLGAACGVLYHFLNLIHDTTVDTSTGTMMVKDSSTNGAGVEVSIRAHGKMFEYDGTVLDSTTGERKGCVSSAQAFKMFEYTMEGTHLKFVKKDAETGNICVVPIGYQASMWTDEIIDMGGLVLTPDLDCSKAIVEQSKNEEGRMLVVDDVYEKHLALRQQFWGNCDGRRLETVAEVMKQKQDSMVPLGYIIETRNICL